MRQLAIRRHIRARAGLPDGLSFAPPLGAKGIITLVSELPRVNPDCDLPDDSTTSSSGEADHDDTWIDVDSLGFGSESIGGMVVRSGQMRRVIRTMARLGPYKATVLIHGESGTGKELVARALHTLGPVPKGPFVTFNCSNLVESLAESQLFGHVRGAFTDAREDSLGYFRSANCGTLFLDEIGELPLRLQPKLLRAVESHEVQPVGSAQSYKVDIRLIAATNRDLRAMVKSGQFRADLYYRLSATAILVPPLRERRDALEALAAHFVEHYNRLFGKQIRCLSRRALTALKAYDWPGNVREFSHAIQSAVMLTDNDRIEFRALPENLQTSSLAGRVRPWTAPAVPAADANSGPQRPQAQSYEDRAEPLLLDKVIKKTLIRSLEETDGNRRRAAGLLGISRSTLYRMLTRYGLETDGVRRRPGNLGSSTGSEPNRF
jgi:DNA-binding NtrC family response regulator